jgi:hypothetical protein
MQAELDAASPLVPIEILGVNQVGSEAGNPTITTGRVLPWLQDTPAEDAWGQWCVRWSDFVVLDGSNGVYTVYSLAQQPLWQQDVNGTLLNYEELKAILLAAAAAEGG